MKCQFHPDREAAGYCSACSAGVCSECRREVAGTVRCPAHSAVALPSAPARGEKSCFWSVVFSFLPGLGHIYLGAYQRGLFVFLAFAGLVTINSHGGGPLEPLFGVATAFVWFFALFDAYRICRAINAGAAQESAVGAGVLAPRVPPVSARAASLTWGIILMGIGALFVADKYMDLDRFFDFLGDNIGFVFMALGALLLAAYFRRRSKEREKAELSAGSSAGSDSSASSSASAR